MKGYKFYICLMMLGTLSCNAQDSKTEIELKKCINESVNKKVKELFGKDPFDFYVFINSIEKSLISNNLLKDNSRNSYLDLLNEIIHSNSDKHNEMYAIQNKIIEDYGFKAFSTEAIFNQCPYKVSVAKKNSEGKLIYTQGSILNQLLTTGYDNEKLLKKLINNIDERNFKKEVYRAPIVLLVMININNNNNPDVKRMQDYTNKQKLKKN